MEINKSPDMTDLNTTVHSTNQIIHEGQAEVITSCRVFYNPVQEFNRDLSIAVLSVFSELYRKERKEINLKKCVNKSYDSQNKKLKTDEDASKEDNILLTEPRLEEGKRYEDGLTILEALSATGLRSVRYAKEIPGIKLITANDLSPNAIQSIRHTIAHNKVEHLIQASHDEATIVMYRSRKPELRFTAIDLDPYGCPAIFLDSAVQAVCDGGLLLVTATDMAVLAGNAPETCYTKYGAVSLRSKACHEMALRILLQCIEAHATRYGRHIVPLLSVSVDFYIRVFVRVFTSPKECKRTTSKLAMVHQCTGCESTILQPLGILKPFSWQKKKSQEDYDKEQHEANAMTSDIEQVKYSIPTGPYVTGECQHCKHRYHTGGPIWTAPLHDKPFVARVLDLCVGESERFGTSRRLQGVLSVVTEELDVPLYFTLEKLCSTLHLETIPLLTMRSAILNAGFDVSYSHACKTSIKTNAPAKLIWDILRTWEKDHPVKKERLINGTPAFNILEQSIETLINLTTRADANPESRRKGCARYPQNPTAHWGPGTRSTIMIGQEKIAKSVRNQNKKGTKRAVTDVLPVDKDEKCTDGV